MEQQELSQGSSNTSSLLNYTVSKTMSAQESLYKLYYWQLLVTRSLSEFLEQKRDGLAPSAGTLRAQANPGQTLTTDIGRLG